MNLTDTDWLISGPNPFGRLRQTPNPSILSARKELGPDSFSYWARRWFQQIEILCVQKKTFPPRKLSESYWLHFRTNCYHDYPGRCRAACLSYPKSALRA